MMAVELDFDVREFPKSLQRNDNKDFFRVHISPVIMQTLGFVKGDLCTLKSSGNTVGTAVIWEMTARGIKTKEIQISSKLLSFYNIDSRGKISLLKMKSHLPNASSIVLYEAQCSQSTFAPLTQFECKSWALLLEYELYRAEVVSPGMLIDDVLCKGQKRSFRIQSINQSRNHSLYRFHSDCKVLVLSDETQSDTRRLVVSQQGAPGSEALIDKLNSFIAPFGHAMNLETIPRPLPLNLHGIILHGPPGIGKSLLLRKIGEAGWRTVVHIDTEVLAMRTNMSRRTAILELFENAIKAQPSVILIDGLTNVIGNYDSPLSGDAIDTTETLRHQMLRLEGTRTLVVATSRSLTHIDPALMIFPSFSLLISIPVPNTASRASILKALQDIPQNEKNACIDYMASHTQGFVGGDLGSLTVLAAAEALNRNLHHVDELDRPVTVQIENSDVDIARTNMVPALRKGTFVEVPETRWSDISGQKFVKDFLNVALCQKNKDSPFWKILGIKPRKGLLLYGPPGCSKTMLARAAATESGHSFIAVNGAEMLSMYVGETERKLRECFRLAKSVSPSVIFFDEIDAIGTPQIGGEHSGVHSVTTLLGEMSGIEELSNVFVLAATNRPDVLDIALTRAGRLDQALYIGPPDLDARRHMLAKRFPKQVVAEEVNMEGLAAEMDGYSGAEIVTLCNEAAHAAFLESGLANELVKLNHKHFTEAMGRVKKAITPEVIAYYEAYQNRK